MVVSLTTRVKKPSTVLYGGKMRPEVRLRVFDAKLNPDALPMRLDCSPG